MKDDDPAPHRSDWEQLKAMRVLVVPALAVVGAFSLWDYFGGPQLLSAVLDPIGKAVPDWGTYLGATIVALAVIGQLIGLAAWIEERKTKDKPL